MVHPLPLHPAVRVGVLTSLLGLCVTLGLVFQAGHFVEHLVQFGVWIFGTRTAPFMSPIAMGLSHWLGSFFETVCDGGLRQMMLGMEVLHLIGNSIFLLTIIGLYKMYLPTTQVRWALYVEAFHLYEHIMLTGSVYFLNKTIGLSTMFGSAVSLWGQAGGVGYRVSWHFVMNLIPTILVMRAFLRARRRQRTQS